MSQKMTRVNVEIPKPKMLKKLKMYNMTSPVVDVGGRKVLFVFDYPTTEETDNGELLTGVHGDLFNNLLKLTKKSYLKPGCSKRFSWSAITYENFRFSKANVDRRDAQDYSLERVESYIKRYKPDSVVCFGSKFYGKAVGDTSKVPYGMFLGSPVEVKRKGFSYTLFPNLNTVDILNGSHAADGHFHTLGFVCRWMANGIFGDRQYKIDIPDTAACAYVDTIKKFDMMMEEVSKARVVAIDSETANLCKIKNTLLTVQFATVKEYGYLLPYLHKDTPFTTKELEYIRSKLKAFFEGANKAKYFVYQRGEFDLTVFRTQLGIDYFPTPIWDCIAGENQLDENGKFLTQMVNMKPYALDYLAVRYGCERYLNNPFGKEDRANISQISLADEGFRYYAGVLDVCVPLEIAKQQLKMAQDKKHHKYESMVTEQISDMIHVFSVMAENGMTLDPNYLMYLKTPDSPIELELKKMEKVIYDLPEAKAFNKKLCKEAKIPSKGLFGKVSIQIFDIHKKAHKHRFFFEELGLKVLEWDKQEQYGKVDKAFQEKYEDIPAVAAYTALQKAEKLKSSYVKSLIRMLGSDPDMKATHRIRPTCNHKDIVTGRISMSDPNLQQIPSRGDLGKNIKRLFIAPPGYIMLSGDYNAQEVRNLANLAKDKVLAAAFQVGLEMREKFRLKPDPKLKAKIKTEGDVHRINAAFFFSVLISLVTEELRDAVKSVVFGLIYGRSAGSIAKQIKQLPDFVKGLIKMFFKRFKQSKKWLDETTQSARDNLYVEAPDGRRRNLFGYLLPKSFESAEFIWSAMDRRGVNAPVQGYSSTLGFIGARILDRLSSKRKMKLGMTKKPLEVGNLVHDATYNIALLDHVMFGLNILVEAMTTKVKAVVKKRSNFDFAIDLEFAIEIGPTIRDSQKWDGDIEELARILSETFEFQRQKLGFDLPLATSKMVARIFAQTDDYPDYVAVQVKRRGLPDFKKHAKDAQLKVKEMKGK